MRRRARRGISSTAQPPFSALPYANLDRHQAVPTTASTLASSHNFADSVTARFLHRW